VNKTKGPTHSRHRCCYRLTETVQPSEKINLPADEVGNSPTCSFFKSSFETDILLSSVSPHVCIYREHREWLYQSKVESMIFSSFLPSFHPSFLSLSLSLKPNNASLLSAIMLLVLFVEDVTIIHIDCVTN